MITTQPFGRTGHMSTRTLFGAAALGGVTQQEADQTLELLFQYGINHIDTAASYGDAELRIGPWMGQHRDKFFLATKTEKRPYAEARDQIRESLRRMRVERLDLIQIHSLSDPEEWEVAMGPDGALKACIEAREQGLVRFIGVTGHGVTIPRMHLRALERFDFDSVLLPYNYIMMRNEEYAAAFEDLARICQERNVALQTIKSITRAPWGDREQNRATWYEPLENQAAIDTAVHWVLSRPGVFLNTVGDIHVLPRVLDAASRAQQHLDRAALDQQAAALELTPLFT